MLHLFFKQYPNNFSLMHNNNEVISLKIEISRGHYEYIKVFDEDEPEDLARAFCEKFSLDSRIQEGLCDLIEYHIDNVLESQSPIGLSYSNYHFSTPPKSGLNSPLSGDQNKLDLYYALFEALSEAGGYKISYDTLNVSSLPKSMQRILEPMIDELKETGESIGFSEFTRAMDTLLPTLNARDRILLLSNYLEGKPKTTSQSQQELHKEIQNLKAIKEYRMHKQNDTQIRASKSMNPKYY